MHHEDAAAAVHERLAPQADDIVVRKVRHGAMSTTDLDRQLRKRNITTLVVPGIATSGVVLSTVTDAADRDYRLCVLSDGVTDPDTEVHDVLLHRVFPHVPTSSTPQDCVHCSGPVESPPVGDGRVAPWKAKRAIRSESWPDGPVSRSRPSGSTPIAGS
ncbi:cysteine hydrolase family protein [Streptomyces sp. NPDC021224]|uniref:cysteine hydrolase family protein n=1 Tax=unclassified Streptomyces TaxID=2593676 RepID=UPI003795C6D0